MTRTARPQPVKTEYCGKTRYNVQGAQHLYCLEVTTQLRPSRAGVALDPIKDWKREEIYVEANTRTQAASIARRNLHHVHSVNMVG